MDFFSENFGSLNEDNTENNSDAYCNLGMIDAYVFHKSSRVYLLGNVLPTINYIKTNLIGLKVLTLQKAN